MTSFTHAKGLARWRSVRFTAWLIGPTLIVLGCTDPSAPTLSLTGYQGHAEGVVRARNSFATIEGCRLSYSVSLLIDGNRVQLTDGNASVVTDAGGNYDFNWFWIGACPPGARVEIRLSTIQTGFQPLDTARVIGAPCQAGSSFTAFSVFLTPGPPSTPVPNDRN